MNTNHKFLTALAFSIFLGVGSMSAQTVVYYSYDGAGNRTYRGLIKLPSMKSAKIADAASYIANKPEEKKIEEKQGDLKIIIYPNPTHGELKIETEGYETGTTTGVYLYNLSGSLLINKSPAGATLTLDLSGYPVGIYILKIQLGDMVSKWKVLKE